MSSSYPLWSDTYKNKLIQPENLASKSSLLKSQEKTIVTLNGSFDLLHAGHLQMIYEASLLADVLIVALNSDSSIKKYKGPQRPLIPLEERLQMMAAFGFVDFVTWFDETDPRELLDIIQPHVHANGSEYGLNCIEQDIVEKNGGTIHLVQRIPGLATSQIIEKIVGQHSSCV